MAQLTAMQKDELESELLNEIIPVVGRNNQSGMTIDLASAIRRNMSNNENYFPNYPANQIYQNVFDGNPSDVYDYFVNEYPDLLAAEGAIERADNYGQQQQVQQGGSSSMFWTLAVVGGLIWYFNR